MTPRERNRLLALAITLSVVFPLPTLLYLRQTGIRMPLDHFVLRMGLGYPLLLVVAVPSTMGMMLLRLVASIDDPDGNSPDEKTRLDVQMELQAFLRRFLAVVGGLLTLGILGVGALFQAYNAYNAANRPQIEQTPTELLLVLGGIWAGVVAGLYIPAQAAIERRGRAIVDGLCPFPAVASPAFAGDLDRRERLGGALGLGGTARSRLEDGVLILSPLIGGILSSFIGGT